MSLSANVVDFTLFRKRRLARTNAERMWALYTTNMGLAAQAAHLAAVPDKTRQA